MMTINDQLAERISELELALSSFVQHPEFVEVDEAVGPYCVKRIWFDELDSSPVLGVTYEERSVKNEKKLSIFKPVRIGVAMAIVRVWGDKLPELTDKLLLHAPPNEPWSGIRLKTDEILVELRKQ